MIGIVGGCGDSSDLREQKKMEQKISEKGGKFELDPTSGKICSVFWQEPPEDLNFEFLISPVVELTSLTVIGLKSPSNASVLIKASSLVKLDLSKSELDSNLLSAIEGCQSLEELNVSDCVVTEGIGKKLCKLKNLELLRANRTKFTAKDLLQLRNLTKLRGLVIRGDKIGTEELEAIKLIENLEFLVVGGREIGDNLCCLASLLNLWHLEVRDSPIDGVCFELFSEVPLKVIVLENSEIKDEGVVALSTIKTLEVLGLGRTEISDSSINQIEKMTNLKQVSFFGTSVSAEAVNCLRKAKPNLEVIYYQ